MHICILLNIPLHTCILQYTRMCVDMYVNKCGHDCLPMYLCTCVFTYSSPCACMCLVYACPCVCVSYVRMFVCVCVCVLSCVVRVLVCVRKSLRGKVGVSLLTTQQGASILSTVAGRCFFCI